MLIAVGLAIVTYLNPPLSIGQNVGATKTIKLPAAYPLGHFSILSEEMPIRATMKEEREMRRDGRYYPKLQGGELRGTITYPQGSGLWITLAEDEHGTIVDKLKASEVMDHRDIHALSTLTKVDLTCLKHISRFENLRDLTLVVGDDLEGADGSACLTRLKKLRYLYLARENDCVFGSKRVCEAIRVLDRLKYLSIPCEKLTDANIAILGGHPSLEVVYLRSRRPVLGPRSLQVLQKLPRLRELFVVCTDDVRDIDVMAFAEIPTLETLGIATNAPLSCQERISNRRPDCLFSFQEPSSEIQ
jgi:hypothetical protein